MKPTNKKLVIKTLTLRRLDPVEVGEVFGGACCHTMGCKTDKCGPNPIQITKDPGKPAVGWSVSASVSVSVSAGPVSISLSYSYSYTG
jgi:hypothetical protein